MSLAKYRKVSKGNNKPKDSINGEQKKENDRPPKKD